MAMIMFAIMTMVMFVVMAMIMDNLLLGALATLGLGELDAQCRKGRNMAGGHLAKLLYD